MRVCWRARERTGFGEVLVGAAEVGGVAAIGDLPDVLSCSEHNVSRSALVRAPCNTCLPLAAQRACGTSTLHTSSLKDLPLAQHVQRKVNGYRQTPRRGRSRGTRCSRPRAPLPTATEACSIKVICIKHLHFSSRTRPRSKFQYTRSRGRRCSALVPGSPLVLQAGTRRGTVTPYASPATLAAAPEERRAARHALSFCLHWR